MSGCVAGTAATTVSFPFDVLRTRMIGQGKPKVCTTKRTLMYWYHQGYIIYTLGTIDTTIYIGSKFWSILMNIDYPQ